MRILLVNWQDRENPQAGGAEVHLHEIFGRLAARGHEVHLYCSGWPGVPATATLDGIAVHRTGGRYSWALRGRRAIRRALAAARYDVVAEDINKVPLFTAGLSRLPSYVIVPHLFGTTAFAEASWPMASVVWVLERPIPRAYRAATFHAISAATRDDLVARGVPPERIRVIYPGVDARAYRPVPGEGRMEEPTFLYVGRLKRYKGVDTAIRALAMIRETRPDVRLDVAGTGDDGRRLRRLAESLGLHDAVRFHGFVSEDTKRVLLRRAWGNVFPSSKEGWGMTNLEAAASGTPSLASDASALRESVRHGETGYLVPVGDVRAWADRMMQLAADPPLVERLGAAARRFAGGFAWERTAGLTERHLEECIDAAPSARAGGRAQSS